MERRAFLKSSCNVCLLSAAGVLLGSLSACAPAAFPVFKAEIVDDEIQLPLSSIGPSGLQLVRPMGWYYDIAVQKKEDATYEAMLLKCTHQDNQLSTTGKGYTCSLHGSQFDRDGHVTKGPAERPLKQFKTSVTPENLIIHTQS